MKKGEKIFIIRAEEGRGMLPSKITTLLFVGKVPPKVGEVTDFHGTIYNNHITKVTKVWEISELIAKKMVIIS